MLVESHQNMSRQIIECQNKIIDTSFHIPHKYLRDCPHNLDKYKYKDLAAVQYITEDDKNSQAFKWKVSQGVKGIKDFDIQCSDGTIYNMISWYVFKLLILGIVLSRINKLLDYIQISWYCVP